MTSLAKRDPNTIDSLGWNELKEQARIALSSRYLPKAIATPEQAITIALAGKELGLPPLTAFRSIHLIDGKITLSADLMHGLVYQRVPGARCDVVHTDNTRAVVEAQRAGGKVVSIAFTMEDAQRAGLTSKDNWKKYPAAMLRARAIAAACRAAFPEVFLGCYTPDELEAEGPTDAAREPRVEAPKRAPAAPPPDPVPGILEGIRAAPSLSELDAYLRGVVRVIKGLGDADRDALRAATELRRKELAKPAPAPPEVDDDVVEDEERAAMQDLGDEP